MTDSNKDGPLLRVEGLSQYFKTGKRELHAVEKVSFEVMRGEVFSLVGESGCGKTTTGRSIIKIYDITDGNIYFKGQRISAGTRSYTDAIKKARAEAKGRIAELKRAGEKEKIIELKQQLAHTEKENREKIRQAIYDVDNADREYSRRLVLELKREYSEKINKEGITEQELRAIKREYKKRLSGARKTRLVTEIQMIFQDPMASLNPRMTVREIISEGLVINGFKDREYIDNRVYEMLELVGLQREHLGRYPHEFSGGQRQRIGIARAVIMRPEMIIADEPVSALDVSVQAQVINLLNELKEKLSLTILFIAHDLSVVKYFSDKIGVMYFGRLVEIAPTEELFRHPLHPYTRSLLSAIPLPDPISERKRQRIVYNKEEEHDYSVDKASMRQIREGHLVYCNDREEKRYREELMRNE